MRLNRLFAIFMLGSAAIALSACSSSTSAIDDDKAKTTAQAEAADSGTESKATETEKAEEAPKVETANVIRNAGTVQNRGVFIKLLVNKNPITNFDVNRRAAFLKLRRVPGNRAKLAEDEMIEQILKLQEARRLGVLANQQSVDEAYANFAKGNRMSQGQLATALGRAGVGVDHFKNFIRTQISWQRAVSRRFQAEAVQVSEQDVVLQLRESGTDKPQLTEYNFQQVVFVVPERDRSSSRLAARRVEANAFRQRFTSCDETINLAKTLKDVSVIERNRVLEPELPTRWKDEIPNVDANGTTRAKETERGIEILAICQKRQVNDDRAALVSKQSQEFESFNEKGSDLSKTYLDQLKSAATIVYQ